MQSPFPGMDPYLEGADWSDFHNSLAYVLKRMLVQQVTPDYVVRLEKYVVLDTFASNDIDISYPDVAVWQKPPETVDESTASYNTPPTITPPNLSLPFPVIMEVPVPVVEIRDASDNRLVTSIEILSPVNKRLPGFNKHLHKQQKLHEKGVHLLEIDLLRQGRRAYRHPKAQSAHYLVALLRAGHAKADVWTINIKDPLPQTPVPLKSPDKDAVLNLQEAFHMVYEESDYAHALPYSNDPPPPVFMQEELIWIRERIELA